MAKNRPKNSRRKGLFSKDSSPEKNVEKTSKETKLQKAGSPVTVPNNTTVEVRLEPELNKVLEIIEKKSSETSAILQSNAENVQTLNDIVSSMVDLVEAQQRQVPELQRDLDSLKSQDHALTERLSAFESSQSDVYQQLKTLAAQLSSETVESMVMAELNKQTEAIAKHAQELRAQLDLRLETP